LANFIATIDGEIRVKLANCRKEEIIVKPLPGVKERSDATFKESFRNGKNQMKSCPACQRAYSDETLIYCLDDGSLLRSQYHPEATIPISFERATNPVQTKTLPLNWSQQPPPKNSRWLLYSVVALLVVAILGGIVLWLQSREKDSQPRGLSGSPMTNTSAAESQPASSNDNKQSTGNRNISLPNINNSERDGAASGNPPTAQQLVGAWQGKVSELGGETFEVTFTAYADGTYQYSARNRRGQTLQQDGTWQYSNGILYQTFPNGASGKGSIEWIDKDTFELTIIDNGVPAYNGIKRRYHRAG
jgi:hypothetical protein